MIRQIGANGNSDKRAPFIIFEKQAFFARNKLKLMELSAVASFRLFVAYPFDSKGLIPMGSIGFVFLPFRMVLLMDDFSQTGIGGTFKYFNPLIPSHIPASFCRCAMLRRRPRSKLQFVVRSTS